VSPLPRFLRLLLPFHGLRRLALCLLFGLIALHASAQRPNKWIAKGEAALAERSYLKAIEYFEWSLHKDSSLAAISGIARAHQALSDFPKAAAWWRLAAARPDATPLTHYQLGRALMSINKADAAIASFQRYHEAAPADPLALRYRDVAEWLPAMFKDTALYAVERLRINSKNADFGATWYRDGILFCSNRPREMGVVHSSASDGLPLTDLYFSRWDSAKGWQKPTPFDQGNSRYHDGPACADTTRGLVYLSRSTRTAAKGQGAPPLALLSFTDVKGKWTPAAPLSLPEGAAYAHPALSPDARRLYFSSDLPGGQGGTDIWYLEAQGDAWSAPINVGPAVNSPGNESYPALQADGTLYFSSDGHPGLGGLDIFFARPEAGGWRPPLNPGAPLNSPKDDFAFLPKADGAEGLFSSNRAGGNDELWSYRRSAPSFECQPQYENQYCFSFEDVGTIETDTMPLLYLWSMGDGATHRGLKIFHCFPGPGDYIVELNLIDSISGFVFLNEATYEMQVRDSVQPYITAPFSAYAGSSIDMDALKSTMTGCDPGKYFWEFGDGQRGIGTKVSHTYATAGTYEIRLGITGDQAGTSAPCKACVTRPIQILPVGSPLPEAPSPLLPNGQPRNPAPASDSVAKQLLDLRDSTGIGFRVKIATEEQPLSRKEPPLSLLDDQKSIREIKVGDTYAYTYGDEPTRSEIYEKFSEAQEKGIEEAVVVAFKNDREIGIDSISSMRVPGKRSGDTYTIFSGEIRDSKGNPLSAELSIEDLLHNVQVVKVQTDSVGAFRLRLPNGELYGYYLEAQGYFPYSDQLDLRDRRVNAQDDLLVERDVKMATLNEVVDQGTSIPINNVFFDYDRSVLRPTSYAELDRLIRMMKANPDIRVEIYGHTDSDGEALYNLELSKRRADAVAAYIRKQYPAARIMNTFGYGEMRPLTSGNTPEEKQRNRRVEFRLFRD
jgi:outer membrane protein OmpA-like peptidoglycan-associated protein/tetratricopeptide (TPR) repeat protein